MEDVLQLCYRDQAIRFLCTFWGEGPNFGKNPEEGEYVWEWFQGVVAADPEGTQGSALDNVNVQRVLQIIMPPEELDLSAFNVEGKTKITLLQLLVAQFKLDWNPLVELEDLSENDKKIVDKLEEAMKSLKQKMDEHTESQATGKNVVEDATGATRNAITAEQNWLDLKMAAIAIEKDAMTEEAAVRDLKKKLKPLKLAADAAERDYERAQEDVENKKQAADDVGAAANQLQQEAQGLKAEFDAKKQAAADAEQAAIEAEFSARKERDLWARAKLRSKKSKEIAHSSEVRAEREEKEAKEAEAESEKKAEAATKEEKEAIEAEAFATEEKEKAAKSKAASDEAAAAHRKAEADVKETRMLAEIAEEKMRALLKIAEEAEKRAQKKEEIFAGYKAKAEEAKAVEMALEAEIQAQIDEVDNRRKFVSKEKQRLLELTTSTKATMRGKAAHELAMLDQADDDIELNKQKFSNEALKRRRAPIIREKEEAVRKMEMAHEPYLVALQAAQKERDIAEKASENARLQRIDADNAVDAAEIATSVAEEAAETAESERLAAESAYVHVVEQRISAEKASLDALYALQEYTEARTSAEKSFKNAQLARSSAEENERQAEAKRLEAEAQTKRAEEARKAATAALQLSHEAFANIELKRLGGDHEQEEAQTAGAELKEALEAMELAEHAASLARQTANNMEEEVKAAKEKALAASRTAAGEHAKADAARKIAEELRKIADDKKVAAAPFRRMSKMDLEKMFPVTENDESVEKLQKSINGAKKLLKKAREKLEPRSYGVLWWLKRELQDMDEKLGI